VRLLRLDVRSNDVANLLDHMTSVERWRDGPHAGLAWPPASSRTARAIIHCQGEKGISDFDRGPIRSGPGWFPRPGDMARRPGQVCGQPGQPLQETLGLEEEPTTRTLCHHGRRRKKRARRHQ